MGCPPGRKVTPAAGDQFYVIEDGSFTIYNERDGAELARVGKGSCFGELALLRQARPAFALLAALPPCHMMQTSNPNVSMQGLAGSKLELRLVERKQ